MRWWIVVVTALVAALLTAGPAGAVVQAPTLAGPDEPVLPGDAVTVTGTGFDLPEPETCEVIWTGPAPKAAFCGLDGIPFARLLLSEEPVTLTAQHEVTVCVPSCESPWAGTASGTLLVVPGETPEPETSPEPDTPTPTFSPEFTPAPEFTGILEQSAAALRLLPALTAGAVEPESEERLALFPDVVAPGDSVSIEAPTLPRLAPDVATACRLLWTEQPIGECSADDTGGITGAFVVPETAQPGPVAVTACRPTCGDPVAGLADVALVVAAPATPTPTSPPTPTVPTEELALVPDLAGLTGEQAADLLRSVGLQLGAADGEGRVTAQAPGARELVPVGASVDVRLEPVAPVLVEVPLVVGSSVEEAEAALSGVGLALEGVPEDASPDDLVGEQRPEAGTEVERGTAVTVELAVDLDEEPTATSPWLPLVAGTAGLAAAAAAGKVVLDRALVRPRLVVRGDLAPELSTSVATPARPPLQLRLRSVADPDPDVSTEEI